MERPILFSGPMVRAILDGRKTQTRRAIKPHIIDMVPERCPYGKVGDNLWVRETWSILPEDLGTVIYRADMWDHTHDVTWKPSVYMPKGACRLWLEITGVKVERLQDINNRDACAEGVNPWPEYGTRSAEEPEIVWNHIDPFKKLWTEINGKESWVDNPFVWVIEFKRAVADNATSGGE